MSKRFGFILLISLLVFISGTLTASAGTVNPASSSSAASASSALIASGQGTVAQIIARTPIQELAPGSRESGSDVNFSTRPDIILRSSTAETNAAARADSDNADLPSDITTPGGLELLTRKYESVFFDSAKSSGAEFLVTIAASREPRTQDLLRFVITGSVLRSEENSEPKADDPMMILLYIRRGGRFEPLLTLESRSLRDSNIIETQNIINAKVRLDNLGNDKVNELRVIAFRKSQVEDLVLGDNLQITDKRVVARNMSVVERIRIGIQTMESSFKQIFR